MNAEPHRQGCWCPAAAALSPGTSAASLWTPTKRRRSRLQKHTRDDTSQIIYAHKTCISYMSDVNAQTELTGENFTRGHFSHWQQSFNWCLCLQLCSPLVMNNGLSWSVHLLLKPQEELRLACQLNYCISIEKIKMIYVFGTKFYLECVA